MLVRNIVVLIGRVFSGFCCCGLVECVLTFDYTHHCSFSVTASILVLLHAHCTTQFVVHISIITVPLLAFVE